MSELARCDPDLILTDITMPGRSGLEFIKDLRAERPDLAILVISMHDEVIYAERVLRAGARGYIMKEAGGDNLLAAIRQVLAGRDLCQPEDLGRDPGGHFPGQAEGIELPHRAPDRPGI